MNNLEFIEFWFYSEEVGASSLSQFYIIFLLFGLWAVIEIFVAIKLSFSDKKFCIIVCVSIIFSLVAVQKIFLEHSKFVKYDFYSRTSKPPNFRLNAIPEIQFFSEWDKFKLEKKLNNRDYFQCFDRQHWEKLKQEFVDAGGEFLKQELGNLFILPTGRDRQICISIDSVF